MQMLPNTPISSAARQSIANFVVVQDALAPPGLRVGALHAPSEGRVVVVVPSRIPIGDGRDHRIAVIGLRGAVIVLHLVHQAHDVGAFQRAEGARAQARQNIPIEDPLVLCCPTQALGEHMALEVAGGDGGEGLGVVRVVAVAQTLQLGTCEVTRLVE